MGLPTQQPKFARIFFTGSLVGPRLRREGAEKWQPSQATKTREGGDKKELQRYTTKGRRTTWCLNSSLVAYAYRKTRVSRSYQPRPERLPKNQSVKKLSTKARAPSEGPERQEVINQGQSAYRRTRASRSYQQRPERLLKDQTVKKLSAKARAPTEGPERQEIISKGQ